MIQDKLLAKNPRRRYQTMKEVQAALEAFGLILPQPIAPVVKPAPLSPDEDVKDLSDQTASRERIAPGDLAREVQQLGRRWSLAGEDLVAELHSREMKKLAAVVSAAATIADEMEMQPRISIEYPRLRLSLAKVSTVVDLVFAARIEAWLRDQGW
jgi:pterin-4a-carbinolamine dehydratase